MKIIVDSKNKTLQMLENERSIFRGEYGADVLELYFTENFTNEYPTITALLSNGRKIGPYTTDEGYSMETINGVEYVKASFTLSKQNGFTLSEGKMMITIWMNSNGRKEAIGNVTLNVINTTAFDDGDIIVSGDVEGTLVNYRVELENLQSQINTSNVAFNNRITNVEQNKADKQYVDVANEELSRKINQNEMDISANSKEIEKLDDEVKNKADLSYVKTQDDEIKRVKADVDYVDNEITMLISDVADLYLIKADTQYVDEKFNQILGEGASATLDTISEISKALEEHNDEYDSLLAVVGNKANKTDIPTKLSQLEQDIEVGGGVSAEAVMTVIEENGEEIEQDYSIGTSSNYDATNDKQLVTAKAVKSMIDETITTALEGEY